MSKKTLTRACISEHVCSEFGLSRTDSTAIVKSIFQEITETLIQGEQIKIPSFGTLMVRKKYERIGRNPRTKEEVAISSRRVCTFRTSRILKKHIN